MFICDKRKVVLPTSITIDGNEVKVVSSFRLLGVILDNKLNFSAHISATCLMVNRKLFSIKRLFYLATSVKMQFFKSFILPYFDYCLSLSVYFPKATLQKICTCYYATLFRLFKLDFTDFDANKINDFLKNYGLYAFQHRVFMRLSLFTYKALSDSAPPILRDLISTSIDTEHSSVPTSYPSREKRVLNLRSGKKTVLNKPDSKYAKISFSSIFSKVKEKCISSYHNRNFHTFKNSICANLNSIADEFCTIFPAFFYLSYRKYNFKRKKIVNKHVK